MAREAFNSENSVVDSKLALPRAGYFERREFEVLEIRVVLQVQRASPTATIGTVRRGFTLVMEYKTIKTGALRDMYE
jgi:hypothetical protein